MEIIDFLRAARRRLVLIILLPLLSMAATEAVLLLQPPTYTATAVVDAPALVGGLDAQYTGAQGVNQFVAAFQATASGPVVRRAVAAQTKVSPAALNNGLVVSQRGTSSSLAVDYTSRTKATVVPVLNGVTSTTLRTLFESQVHSAQARVDAAKKAVDDATTALGEFTAKNAMADPQKAYEAQLNRVNAMVQQQASMRAAGNAVGAAAMGAPIAAAKGDLVKFTPILTEYRTLTTTRDTAVQSLDEATAKLLAAQAQLDNADPSKIVYIGGAHQVDRMQTILTTTASVGAAAFLLALVLVLILEMVARARASRRPDTGSDASTAQPAAGSQPPVDRAEPGHDHDGGDDDQATGREGDADGPTGKHARPAGTKAAGAPSGSSRPKVSAWSKRG